MADRDILDQLQAGRDALRRAQEAFARYTMQPEQRKAMLESMAAFTMPGDQLQAVVDMIDAFGPPLAQIEALRSEIGEQREQLEAMADRLEHMEGTLDRLTMAGEQLVAFQEPYVKMASMLTGQSISKPRGRSDDDTDATEADDDTADGDDE